VRALKWIGGGVLVLIVALALFVAFGLHLLRGPIERAVTSATGRELRIEGDLRALWSWTHPRFRAERVSFANPAWASEEHLLRAEAIEGSISVLPLLAGRVVVPYLQLEKPEIALELTEDGRKTWLLDRDQKD
jgi:uncharacterized protein involved in outer membrane biogenesis